MKVEQVSEITAENLQAMFEEFPEEMEVLTGVFNELLRSYNLFSNKRVSLGDNIDCDTRTITVKGGSEIRFARSKLFPPRQIIIGRVKTTGPALTVPVQILDWRTEGSEIIVTTIVGLTTDQAYDITLTVYY